MGGTKRDGKQFVLQGVGPAQSDTLIHFTSRGEYASFTPKVPEQFRQMTAQERLDSILGSGRLYGYPPFGAQQACVCFSESPPDHLSHLIADRGFSPWGVVVTRADVLSHDGGAVAYVTEAVYKQFVAAGIGHWAVPIRENSQWMHEREWRAPLCEEIDGERKQYSCFSMTRAHAILIGDRNWRPTQVTTAYRNGCTGEQAYPNDPAAIPVKELPEMWRNSAVWVWSRETRSIDEYQAGVLA
ncbi:hypothetical protein QEZ40_005522 [Streptomyces katrae]|uniref:Uncharacterized protein n=1 Tax=Streptomyces katrae TaxID=68223 RepID=A0ABT7H1X8_9ACTN|nr:hypothetical protein [Streptomyces katrae]MDK9499902.1 hypothetical protein [Streptomyces katrae]